MAPRRVDAFGIAKIGDATPFRARVIQTGSTSFAIFPESGDPGQLEFHDTPTLKGRLMNAVLVDDQEFVFQRAGCGCQTPQHLRGGSRKFLELLETADA